MEEYKEIERSIIVRFRKEIWRKFTKAVRDYKLINEGDVIAVCISGGKDSFLLAKCIEELQKHGSVNIEYIIVEEKGPDHDKTFIAEVKCNGKYLATGQGNTKKQAEMEAARIALQK